MKELSIEEKAKRYDEAIERAKRVHNGAKSDKESGVTDKITEYTIQLTEAFFPELKESEDERIRKDIINLVKKSNEYGGYVLHKWEADKMLAWLEKQGEQKSEEEVDNLHNYLYGEQKLVWSEEDERLFQIVIDILDRQNHLGNISRTDLIACVRKLKSLKDKYTWKPSDEQMDALDYYANSLCTYCDRQDDLRSLFNDLKNLRKE